VLKEGTMKLNYKAIAVWTLLLMTAVPSLAQSANRTVIDIPFDFVVGQKTLPAGQYRIEPVKRDSKTTWEIQRTNNGPSAVVITVPVQARTTQESARLVFQKYDEQYVLAQIWTAGDNDGRELVQPSRAARANNAVARAAQKPELITIVAPSKRKND
jgi:hypothetical protein